MGFFDNIKDASTHSTASNATDLHYVVLQVTLKEKFFYWIRKLDRIRKRHQHPSSKRLPPAYNHNRQWWKQRTRRWRPYSSHYGI